jgi:hypothetical protein
MTRYTVATAQLTLLLNSTNLELADKIELDYLILESRQLSISVNDIPPDLTHMQPLDTDNLRSIQILILILNLLAQLQ